MLHPGLKLNSKISVRNYKKSIFTGITWFSTRELSKNHVQTMQRFYKICCYFSQNPQRKGSISRSSFYGQLPNIWFTCLCLKVLRVVAVPYFQSARGVYYSPVWWDSKFYVRRRLFLNISVKRGMNSIWEC